MERDKLDHRHTAHSREKRGGFTDERPCVRPYGRSATVPVAGALLIVTGSLLVIGLALIGLQGTAVPMLSVGICVAAILVMFFSASKVLGRRSRGWGIGAGWLVLVLAVVILLALPSLRDASYYDDVTTAITVDGLIAAAVYLGLGVTVLILLARLSSLRYFDR